MKVRHVIFSLLKTAIFHTVRSLLSLSRWEKNFHIAYCQWISILYPLQTSVVNSKTQNRDINAGVSRGFGIILKGVPEGLVSPYKTWKFLTRLTKTDLRTLCFLMKKKFCLGPPRLLMGFYYANSFSESFLPEPHLGWALKNLSSLCRLPLKKVGVKTDRMPFPPLSTKQLTMKMNQITDNFFWEPEGVDITAKSIRSKCPSKRGSLSLSL